MDLNNIPPAPLSILCIEDDNAAKVLLHTALTEQYPGILVYCAENGAEGLQLFKEHRSKIVITDLSMPVMDGIQMAAEIRLLDPEAVIIAITAFSDSAFLLKAIEIGINQYVLKPVDLVTLLGAIDKHISAIENITFGKLAIQERESTIEFLRIVNASTGIQDLISAAMIFFREQSRCSAVGIRLSNGEDYPYFVAQGFSADFVRTENSLCCKGIDGEVIRDSDGNPVIDCMCGNVICGRFDPEKPFFTAHGSFWTNSTSELLATTCETELQSKTHNRCNYAGFESVALIPLKVGQERLGLLQLNDRHKGVFSLEDIGHWETMASYLAIAIVKFRTEESLKKLNEELDHRVKDRTSLLETALREQESFSYSVSHDLRSPLRHINSYLGMLSENYEDLLPPEALYFLDRTRTASRRMGQLIDDILELSRVSRTNLVKETIDLSKVATHVCDWLCETEPHRIVEVVISDGLTARGDKSLLQQMMENLLGNAWKYTATNPAARIEFGKEVVAEQDIFSISDNGIGFDMAYKDMLFSTFQRLHGAEYEGNGIGLATVKRIVERHGGRVWADSKVNEGATFYFSL